MIERKSLNIGVIGYGFMGRAHSHAYHTSKRFFELDCQPVLKAICGRDEARARKFAAAWGYDSFETDWRALVERPDVEAVDICTPNNLHKEIALAAAAQGKLVFCEKPLALNVAEATAMCEAVEKAGVLNTVWFNYRRLPAVMLAHELVSEGRLGRVFHYRAVFLQDWTISPDLAQGGEILWRLDAQAAGSGVTGDLLSHCVDTALWMNGKVSTVTATTETFVKERLHTATGQIQEVGVDDACAFLARFENGALGTFESTRFARGHKALYTFEINGERGSILWNLEDLNRLHYFEYGSDSKVRGWREIHVTDTEHPYMDKWWMPGLEIGYEHSFIHQAADLLQAVAQGKSLAPDFRAGLETQKVCDAVLASAQSRKWVEVI